VCRPPVSKIGTPESHNSAHLRRVRRE